MMDRVRLKRVALPVLAVLFSGTVAAQSVIPGFGVPTVTLVRAAPIELSGEVDSNSPVVWDWWDGHAEVFVLTSVAGRPSRESGEYISQLGNVELSDIAPWPTGGNWIESVVADHIGKWYGFYHNEATHQDCGDVEKMFPRIGVARSEDQGATWTDLGIILEAPVETLACDTSNAYFVGGVGDFSAVLDRDEHDVYLYFSMYGREKEDQGVGVARLPWADMDNPVGKISVWNNGVWLPPDHQSTSIEPEPGPEPAPAEADGERWVYPHATSILPPTMPWHTGGEADVFWGPSVHWNESLQQYVMLLNRTLDDAFSQEGIYVSFGPSLDKPAAWSAPYKIMDGGRWYPQVIGLEQGRGTDSWAGRIARFFVSGRSDYSIQFEPATNEPARLKR